MLTDEKRCQERRVYARLYTVADEWETWYSTRKNVASGMLRGLHQKEKRRSTGGGKQMGKKTKEKKDGKDGKKKDGKDDE